MELKDAPRGLRGFFLDRGFFPGSSQILWVNRRDANLRKDQPRDFIARFSVAQ